MAENRIFFNLIFRWQLLTTLYISLIQLATLILLGRFLAMKELGAYAVFSIVFRFALYSLDPGMFFSVIQRHESSPGLLRRLMQSQRFYMVASILVFAGIYLLTGLGKDTGLFIPACSLLMILLIGQGAPVQSRLVKGFHQKEIALAQIAAYTAELVFVVFTVSLFDPANVFCAGVLIRFAVFYGLAWWFLRRLSKPDEAPQDADVAEHLKVSRYNMWSQIMSFVQGQYDTVIVISMFGLPTLGGYILMTEISYMIFAKINPLFNRAIIPVISRAARQNEDAGLLIRESMRSFLYIIFTLYLMFWMYRYDWIQMAYPGKSAELVYYASFLIPVAFSRSVNNIHVSYLLSLGESRSVFRWNIALLVFNYLVIAAFYWFGGDLNQFMWFGILYAVASVIVLRIVLSGIFGARRISASVLGLRQIICLALITATVILCKLFIAPFFLSLGLSSLSVLIILYVLEKERLAGWFKLSMV